MLFLSDEENAELQEMIDGILVDAPDFLFGALPDRPTLLQDEMPAASAASEKRREPVAKPVGREPEQTPVSDEPSNSVETSPRPEEVQCVRRMARALGLIC